MENSSPSSNVELSSTHTNLQLSLNILSKSIEAQQAHGLSYKDYEKYWKYCTRRLGRLRKTLKCTHGRGTKFDSKFLKDSKITTSQHLTIYLFLAERCWAQAMALKSSSLDEDNSARKRQAYHSRSRLKKSVMWANKLHQVCKLFADKDTCTHAQAYYHWINGICLMEQKNTQQALESYQKSFSSYNLLAVEARNKLQNLPKSSGESLSSPSSTGPQKGKKLVNNSGHDLFDLCNMYDKRLREVDTSIQFCKLQGSAGGSIDSFFKKIGSNSDSADSATSGFLMAQIQARKNQQLIEHSKTLKSVKWFLADIPIKNDAIRSSFYGAIESVKLVDRTWNSLYADHHKHSPSNKRDNKTYSKLHQALDSTMSHFTQLEENCSKLIPKNVVANEFSPNQSLLDIAKYCVIEFSLLRNNILLEQLGQETVFHNKTTIQKKNLLDFNTQYAGELSSLISSANVKFSSDKQVKTFRLKYSYIPKLRGLISETQSILVLVDRYQHRGKFNRIENLYKQAQKLYAKSLQLYGFAKKNQEFPTPCDECLGQAVKSWTTLNFIENQILSLSSTPQAEFSKDLKLKPLSIQILPSKKTTSGKALPNDVSSSSTKTTSKTLTQDQNIQDQAKKAPPAIETSATPTSETSTATSNADNSDSTTPEVDSTANQSDPEENSGGEQEQEKSWGQWASSWITGWG